MAAMVEVTCENKSCRSKFQARVADRKRGWARFCSKSCKAVKQEQRTGQYARYLDGGGYRGESREAYAERRREREEEQLHNECMSAMEEGWDGHKVWTS